jgi:transposase
MTNEQLQRWCTSVLAIVDSGEQNVDEIIRKRGHARMSTLLALRALQQQGIIVRQSNTVFRPGQKISQEAPF